MAGGFVTLATADIVAPTNSNFTISISSGKINSASLQAGPTSIPLTVNPDDVSVQVKNLPAGGSFVSMAMKWEPGDTDAVVSVTPPAVAVVPSPMIDLGDEPGSVTIFGR